VQLSIIKQRLLNRQTQKTWAGEIKIITLKRKAATGTLSLFGKYELVKLPQTTN